MPRALDGFVVDGDPNDRLTPNFKLKEFRRPDGTVRVHTELLSVLQLLRNRVGLSIGVAAVDADGFGATLTCAVPEAAGRAADALLARGLIASVEDQETGISIRIPAPEELVPMDLAQAMETAFSVTSAFETTGDEYQQVTGNFDGAGLSFGPAQVNFGTGTLPPLFAAFREEDEAALRECFTDSDDYETWLRVLEMPTDEQVAWANSISTGRNNHDVVQPWKGYLQAVGQVVPFRAIMVQSVLASYGRKVIADVEYLQGLAPDVRIDHLRCLCALYDTAIQQGGVGRAKREIEARVAADRPTDQFELVRIAVEERGKKAKRRFQSDCLSRRLGILAAVPHEVEGRQRNNLNFYKLRDVRVPRLGVAPQDEVVSELERASAAIAKGASLLA